MARLLYIAHRMPYPPDKGERLRAYHQLRLLSEVGGWEITLIASAADAREAACAKGLRKICREVIVVPRGRLSAWARAGWAALRGRCASETFFNRRGYEAAINATTTTHALVKEWDVAIGYCSSMLGPLLAAPARARVLDLVDVDSDKWRRCAASARWPRAAVYRREAARVADLERRALDTCDRVAVTTAAEAELLSEIASAGGGTCKSDKAATAAPLVVGNGVDGNYFAAAPPADKPTAIFTGTMDYAPNVEAVLWFARHAWPLVRRRVPAARLLVVGRDPAVAVRALDGADGIEVSGAVPDVRPWLSRAAAAVAPLRIARGVQNKILEAMATGRPVVASPAALEGLEVEIGREILRADEPQDWADTLCGLFDDAPRRRELGAMARLAVEQRYDWAAQLRPLLECCERLTADKVTA